MNKIPTTPAPLAPVVPPAPLAPPAPPAPGRKSSEFWLNVGATLLAALAPVIARGPLTIGTALPALLPLLLAGHYTHSRTKLKAVR